MESLRKQDWQSGCKCQKNSLIARFMGPTWGPSGADRIQVGPMLAPWTLLSGFTYKFVLNNPVSSNLYRNSLQNITYKHFGGFTVVRSAYLKQQVSSFGSCHMLHIIIIIINIIIVITIVIIIIIIIITTLNIRSIIYPSVVMILQGLYLLMLN